MKKTLIIFGVALLVIGFYLLPNSSNSNENQPKVGFKTVKSVRGDLIVKISAKGIVEPNFQIEVKSKASGKVLTFPFKEGDYIKKGQALLHLNKNDETRNVAKANADLMSGEASLKKAQTALLLQKHRYETDLKLSASEVEEAEANLEDSKEKKNRQSDLVAQKYTSQESFDKAVTNYKVNHEILTQAKARLQAAKDAVYDISMK